MKIKKIYTYNSKNQIWRLIPTNTNKLIIEERDLESKQVFFSTIQTDSGKKIFKNFQLEEKFWIGVENIYKDIIYFHLFEKPDMPGHIGITAFDINAEKILWKNNDQHFLFILDDKLYSYRQNFETRNYFAVDYKTGQPNDEVFLNAEQIRELQKLSSDQTEFSGYYFPQTFYPDFQTNEQVKYLLSGLRHNFVISGKIDYLILNRLLLFNFHEVLGDGFFRNLFKTVDLFTGKYILEEVLVNKSPVFIPESFFVKDDLLFLLIEKTKFEVYRLSD